MPDEARRCHRSVVLSFMQGPTPSIDCLPQEGMHELREVTFRESRTTPDQRCAELPRLPDGTPLTSKASQRHAEQRLPCRTRLFHGNQADSPPVPCRVPDATGTRRPCLNRGSSYCDDRQYGRHAAAKRKWPEKWGRGLPGLGATPFFHIATVHAAGVLAVFPADLDCPFSSRSVAAPSPLAPRRRRLMA